MGVSHPLAFFRLLTALFREDLCKYRNTFLIRNHNFLMDSQQSQQIERIERNIHRIQVDKEAEFLLISDLHWDNPKCDRDLLTKHLKEAQERKAKILINGDFFCMMQGKYDPRRSKKDIRPEHNKANYIDAVIEDAVQWFKPYAHDIMLIGYGNHECYRPDTEVLTSNGWKKITDVTTDDLVAVFDSSHIYYENPNAVVSKRADALYSIEGPYTKQVVSPKHAVVLNDMTKINAEDLYEFSKCNIITEADLAHSRTFIHNESFYSKGIVELLTTVVMDATIVAHSKYNENSKKVTIQFKISKPNKIEYIKSLLEQNGISYTLKECTKTGLNKLQPYYIRVYGDDARMIHGLLEGKKQLPSKFASLTGSEFLEMINAIAKTDGYCTGGSIEWASIDKHNIDVVQSACVLNGWKMSFKEKHSRSAFKNGKLQYVARIRESFSKLRQISITKEEYDGDVYCLNMPSGCFVTRVDGKPALSGNTSIIKSLETDPLQRFVDLLNMTCGSNVQVGGYGGVVDFKIHMHNNSVRTNVAMKYYHGTGGGGAVTKGVIQDQRMIAMTEGYDIIWMGHVHELYHHVNVVECYDSHQKKLKLKEVHQIRTSAYKEEYEDGFGGFHIEKGRPPKPLGGYWMKIGMAQGRNSDGNKQIQKWIEFTATR